MVSRIPFVLNIFILVPVCWSMFFGANGPSVMALRAPGQFTAILILQVIYKALWLAAFDAPVIASGGTPPIGVSLSFTAMLRYGPFSSGVRLLGEAFGEAASCRGINLKPAPKAYQSGDRS